MKRLFLLTTAVVALVAAGAAVAHLKSSDVSPVSATLTATTVAHLQTRTVTCAGQTIEISTGRYSGTAVSTTPDLNGPAEVWVHSVYNTTKKLGRVDGHLKIRGADDRSSSRFTAVNTDGKLDGWLTGHAGRGDGGHPRQPLRLVHEGRRHQRRPVRNGHVRKRGAAAEAPRLP